MTSTYSNPASNFIYPYLQKTNSRDCFFAPLSKDSEFELNKYSIPEPVHSTHELINGESLDLVLVPLLGFDRKGNRLGMGGGYYDRSFAFKNTSNTRKPILMGFAYAFQEVKKLVAENWDVKLDYIATENGIIQC